VKVEIVPAERAVAAGGEGKTAWLKVSREGRSSNKGPLRADNPENGKNEAANTDGAFAASEF